MNKRLWQEAKSIVNGLTLKEKTGQLNQAVFWVGAPETFDALEEKIKNGEVGALVLACSSTAGNDEKATVPSDVLDRLQRAAVNKSRAKIPLLFGRDVIHGHRVVLPVPLALTASFNPEIVKNGYANVAKEAASEGINWTFTPMLDISRDPRWGRCVEGIGEDPYLGEKMAVAMTEGLQGEAGACADDRIVACAKHFIGYGAAEGGRDYAKSEISEYTMRNYYLKTFKAAVNAKVGTVMNSFNEISGISTAASKYLLTDILRGELDFDGFVVSDWGAIEQTVDQGVAESREDAAKICISAGLDMDMACGCYAENLERLVLSGKLDESIVDQSAQRVIYIKLIAGLFDNPYTKKFDINIKKHLLDAKKCSDETMVLLKNENNILPLDKNAKIFAAGPFLHEKRAHNGTWCLDGDTDIVESFYDVLSKECENLTVPKSPYLPDSGLSDVRSGNEALILFFGESNENNGEARCVTDISFPAEQLEYLKKMKKYHIPIIGVMAFGRPIALEEAEPYFDAILYAWHSGTCAARSCADILFGKVNPSGRLPMSFPRVTGQIPIYYNHPKGPRFVNGYYYENGRDGYNYINTLAKPMYPFGYGKSYTEFEYKNLTADKTEICLEDLKNGEKITVCVSVKNIGKRFGKEVSQLYINDVHASMTRPYRELKGFVKNEFAPGEEKIAEFSIGFDELAFYNAKNEFEVEKGEFEVYVGADCYADECIKIRVV